LLSDVTRILEPIHHGQPSLCVCANCVGRHVVCGRPILDGGQQRLCLRGHANLPVSLAIITTSAAFGFTNGVFGFDVIGLAGSNVVIQASTDLQTWIPLQTNLLSSGPLHFSDPQFSANTRRFYRVRLWP
jgi:hypothetical protein